MEAWNKLCLGYLMKFYIYPQPCKWSVVHKDGSIGPKINDALYLILIQKQALKTKLNACNEYSIRCLTSFQIQFYLCRGVV